MRKLISAILLAFAIAAPGQAASGPAAVLPSPGTSFTDCANCPDMMVVPKGSFLMGASLEEEIRQGMSPPTRGRSLPQHTVSFAKPFAIGKYPVTVAQFRDFVNETHYATDNACFVQYFNDGHFIYEKARGFSWRDPSFAQGDNHPVVCISAEDADAYADWLSRKTGHRYTLPNDAQYEYALRAGTTTSFFWGNDRDARACEYSNQPDLDQADFLKAPSGPEYRFQCRDGWAYTSPVGSYKPNPWGLYDMQGNIWEWVADCWNNDYKGAPTDGSTWRQGDCDGRPARGGSFGNAAHSAYAGIRAPRNSSYLGHSWGFRVVRND